MKQNAIKYVCHWDPAFAACLAKKRAKGTHYNVALSHAAKNLVRLILPLEKSGQPWQTSYRAASSGESSPGYRHGLTELSPS